MAYFTIPYNIIKKYITIYYIIYKEDKETLKPLNIDEKRV